MFAIPAFRRPKKLPQSRLAGLTRIIIVGSAFIIVLLLVNQLQFYVAYRRFAEQDLTLTRLAGEMVYLDEVLTMSARMAATTGDDQWIGRYQIYEPLLDATLDQAHEIAVGIEEDDIVTIDTANRALVTREVECINAVLSGDLERAKGAVFSEKYDALKDKYQGSVVSLTDNFDARIAESLASARRWTFVSGAIALVGVVGSMFVLTMSVSRSQRESKLLSDLAVAERRTTLGRMAATLAHELNQPLAAITNYTSAAKELSAMPGQEEALAESLEGAVAQATRAGAIVRRVREFSRPSTPQLTKIDIPSVIRESVQFVMPQARSVRVSIRQQLGDPSFAMADEVQLQQVLVNLLVNAIDASDAGGSVEVRAIAEQKQVVIEVEDHGQGIAPAHAERIFESFYSTKQGGQGLGLAICRDIVEELGGAIEVDARPSGALFRVRLPKAAT